MYPSEQRFLLDRLNNRFMIIWDLVTTKGDLIDMNDILGLRKRFFLYTDRIVFLKELEQEKENR